MVIVELSRPRTLRLNKSEFTIKKKLEGLIKLTARLPFLPQTSEYTKICRRRTNRQPNVPHTDAMDASPHIRESTIS